MSLPNELLPVGLLGTGAAAASTNYDIERSLRFNSADSAYLSRTMSSASSTYTLSMWVKRSTLTSNYKYLFSSGNAGIAFYNGTDQFYIFDGGTVHATTSVYRDTSAWYHILLSVSSNTGAAYINGTQVLSGKNTASLSTTANATNIGRYYNSGSGGYYFDGYIAEVHLIDGQALDPTSFTETDATTGQLINKAYTGSFGTNGFWLKFSDNSAATATTLGKDYSGKNNNWSPTGLSVTAGAGNDSLVDTPTSYGTGNSGGDVRGNYATLNPLTSSAAFTLTNGNLDVSDTGAASPVLLGSIGVNSGKWYWEVTLGNQYTYVGAAQVTSRSSVGYLGASAGQFMYNPSAVNFCYVNGVQYNYSTASNATTGDVIGVALDFDSNVITFYKNGVSQGAFSSNVLGTSTWAPAFKSNSATSAIFNFGQRPFAHPAPSGYKALCTTNLPTPTIDDGSKYMSAVTYDGNGGTQTISGLNFSPDLVWLKGRSIVTNHGLFDQVRGVTQALLINAAPGWYIGGNRDDGPSASYTLSGVTNFTSNGFVQGSEWNASGNQYVAWNWDAGSSTSANNQGSIASSVRVNQSAGFSIVTYPGNETNSTVGHGLGVAPSLIIVRRYT